MLGRVIGAARALAGLFKAAAVNWVDDHAQSMGAALAFYTIFSIAPLLLIVISVAGFFFGEEAARGEIYGQLHELLGSRGALAVQGLLESASRSTDSTLATVLGLLFLYIGATSVFAELQDSLGRIWRAPQRPKSSGLWGVLRARLRSFGLILCIGYLMAAFTERKQGLHDMMCDTLVVDRWAFTDQPQLQRRELGVVTIAVLVITALLALAGLVLMVAAIGFIAKMAS
jgi:uncharacterized BrkB/YihY/UPF0761 family membrane protein